MVRSARLAVVLGALACALVAASPGPAAGSRNVLSYGDSLSVGTDLFLGRYLRGWNVRSSASISRHADDVPDALRAYGRSLPHVVVVSAGTNDDPGRAAGFARIVRPPYQGVSYAGYNRALEAIAAGHENLRVFDWAAMARAHPSWFGSDGVHPTATGYRVRAAAIARVVRGCGA